MGLARASRQPFPSASTRRTTTTSVSVSVNAIANASTSTAPALPTTDADDATTTRPTASPLETDCGRACGPAPIPVARQVEQMEQVDMAPLARRYTTNSAAWRISSWGCSAARAGGMGRRRGGCGEEGGRERERRDKGPESRPRHQNRKAIFINKPEHQKFCTSTFFVSSNTRTNRDLFPDKATKRTTPETTVEEYTRGYARVCAKCKAEHISVTETVARDLGSDA